MIEIVYPWPAKELNPNCRKHWTVKSKAAAAYRATGSVLTRVELFPFFPDFGDGQIHLWIKFFPPDKRARDEDNLSSSLKSLKDGIADALGVNDRRFQSHPLLMDKVIKGGEVRIRFTAGVENAIPPNNPVEITKISSMD